MNSFFTDKQIIFLQATILSKENIVNQFYKKHL